MYHPIGQIQWYFILILTVERLTNTIGSGTAWVKNWDLDIVAIWRNKKMILHPASI